VLVSPRSDDHFLELCTDPIWRLFHLYTIIDEKANEIPFWPNLNQQQIIKGVYVEGKKRICILKSRRMGFSTLIAMVIADSVNFTKNINAAIVDQTQADAWKKLSKIKLAFERMHKDVRPPSLPQDRISGVALDNGSGVTAGLNARGDTIHILHVSEWGPIAYKSPERSKEIRTGALPAARGGLVFVESTFKGNKVGDFYELLQSAMATKNADKTEADYHLYFFGCFDDPSAVLDANPGLIDSYTHSRLDEYEKLLGRKLTSQQRVWWWKTHQEQRLDMAQEYPATIQEALTAMVEGAIYGAEMSEARKQGRIKQFEWDRSRPVYTSWDLGNSDWTVIWFFQLINGQILYIDYYRSRKSPPNHYAQVLREKNYPYGAHLLPHDASHAHAGASWAGQLQKAGIPSTAIKVVECIPDIWLGVGYVQAALPRCVFHAERCDEGIRALETYHTDETSKTVKPKPVHDEASHPCDALRTGIEGMEAGLLRDLEGMRQAYRSKDRDALPNRIRKSRVNGMTVFNQEEAEW
jgi:hypothetical protein